MELFGYEEKSILEFEFDLNNEEERKVFFYFYLLSNKDRVKKLLKIIKKIKNLKSDKMLYNIVMNMINNGVSVNKDKKEVNNIVKENKIENKIENKVEKKFENKVDNRIQKKVNNNNEGDINDILDSFIDSGF